MEISKLFTMIAYIMIIIIIAIASTYLNANSVALSHMTFLEPFHSYDKCVEQFYPNKWCMEVQSQV